MGSETRCFVVSLEVDSGEPLDSRYRGKCAGCGKPLYEGDTIYNNRGFGLFCVDCFMATVVNELLETA